MAYELMEPFSAHDRAIVTTRKKNNPEKPSPVSLQSTSLTSELSLPVLAAYCLREINKYRRGVPSAERYGLELLHRAIMQSDQEAWTWVQRCFEAMVLRLGSSSSPKSGGVSPGERRELCRAGL